MTNQLTVVVILPVLNEQAAIGIALQTLLNQSDPADRIIVADGGSTDDTVSIVQSFGISAITVPEVGRGAQVAAGLIDAQEDVVLVAHADMTLQRESLTRVRECLESNPDCPGGCLGHHFDSPHRKYRLVEWLDAQRAYRGRSYGDQAQFFRRRWIEQAGGFPAQPIMEDLELSKMLMHLGRPAYLNLPVTVSPRRFERRGILHVAWENWLLRQTYCWGGLSACRSIHGVYYPESVISQRRVSSG